MERQANIGMISRAEIALLVVFTFGALLHKLELSRELMLKLTPAILAFTCVSLILLCIRQIGIETENSQKLRSKFIFWVISAFTFTLIIEIVGVNTGLVFGRYVYGDILGTKVVGAPVLIGLNWVIVMLGAVQISESILSSRLVRSFHLRFRARGRYSPTIKTLIQALILTCLASLIATLFDVALEPVAISLGYWEWGGEFIPLQNYLAWFAISSICIFPATLLKLTPKISDYRLFTSYFLIQLLHFFIQLLLPTHG